MPRSLFLISTAVALSLLGDQMLYTVLPVVHEAVGVPVTAIGLLLGANRLIRLGTNTFAGYVVTRWGRHWPFVLALFLGGVSTVAYGVLIATVFYFTTFRGYALHTSAAQQQVPV